MTDDRSPNSDSADKSSGDKFSGDESSGSARDRTASPPNVDFEALAQGGKEVLINFHSQIYRLRVTRNGKLILNK